MEEGHIHMYISIPLSKLIPKVVKLLKGWSSRQIRKELSEWYWKAVIWARWYFVVTVWEINHETIKNYVEQ